MKKILFFVLSFLLCFNIVGAHVKDVQFVGGTGGSKIVELDVKDNAVNTSGVIYDRDASLVYEISYTNSSDYKKKLVDIKLPEADIVLNYDFSNIDINKVVDVGETVKFQYAIKAEGEFTHEQLENLKEIAHAQLVFTSIVENPIENPNTVDVIILLFIVLAISVCLYLYTKNIKVFYVFLVGMLFGVGFIKSDYVLADEVELLDINTDIKYIFSNLAPSCANLDYDGDFCVDWKQYEHRDLVHYLVMEDSKDMSDNYTIGDVSFTLQSQYDVSEQQNGDVVLGVYLADTEDESYLFLVGQDGGVIVPKDASYQFTSYDKSTNNSSNDFKYVKYADFSKFYSNKTTNMEYMLVGIGTVSPMEKFDLSGFETSNVTNMAFMFMGIGENTKNLVLDLKHFDTSNVENMRGMFKEVGYNSETIDIDLSDFDTSKVTDMSYMFIYFGVNAKEMNLNIYDFDTSNVLDMTCMFSYFRFLSPVDVEIDYFKNWDTSKVKSFSGIFTNGSYGVLYNYPAKTIIDVTGLDTQNAERFDSFFYYNSRIKEIKGLETLDTSNVIQMGYMFSGVDVSDLSGVENWDTSNLLYAVGMFNSINYRGTNEKKLSSLNLSKWNVSKLEQAAGMFNNSYYKPNINGWDLSSIQGTSSMFRLVYVDELDLSSVNFGASLDYSSMFATLDGYLYPNVIDLSVSDWNESATTTDMFKGIKGTTIYVKDEKAKLFIEKQAPDCTVLIKE